MLFHPFNRGSAVLVAVLLVNLRAQAQSNGDGFLFGTPSGSFTVRAGFDRATAGGELFSFETDQLTLSRRNFSGFNLVAEVAHRVKPRVDVVFGLSTSRSETPSEWRHDIDHSNRPIRQTTTFVRAPLVISTKAYLAEPGRSIGHFAWIPARYVTYVGAGAGAMWYRFRQQGDFIDFITAQLSGHYFESSGWTPTWQVFAGAEITLHPRFGFTTEARYQGARGRLNGDFSRFDQIDLSGLTLTTGISVRY